MFSVLFKLLKRVKKDDTVSYFCPLFNNSILGCMQLYFQFITCDYGQFVVFKLGILSFL